MDLSADVPEIRRALETLIVPRLADGERFEICALRTGPRRDEPVSSLFAASEVEAAVAMAADLGGDARTRGVYWCLNPIAPNVKVARKRRPLDSQCARRLYLPFDADPVRPADTNANAAETRAADDLIARLTGFLAAEEWPEPAIVDTGNGRLVLYRIDLPADPTAYELIRRCLAGAGSQADSTHAHVDGKVCNAARLVRLPGTPNRKGPHSDERPWRMARLLSVPERWVAVGLTALEALAGLAPSKSARYPIAVKHRTNEVPNPGRSAPGTMARAQAYLARCEAAISGQGGHDQAFKVACQVGPGFALVPREAYALLEREYNPRCVPPWSPRELQHKVDDAYAANAHRIGWKLHERNGPRPAPLLALPPPEPVRLAGEADDDPHRLARVYLEASRHPDGLTLRLWRDEWWTWDGTAWRVAPDREVRAGLTAAIKREFDRLHREALDGWEQRRRLDPARAEAQPRLRRVTVPTVNHAMQALGSLCVLPTADTPAAPAWLALAAEPDPTEDWPPTELLPCRNGLVHLPALGSRLDRPIVRPLTPAYWCPYVLDFDFDPEASTPVRWLEFLGDLWTDEPDSIACLQEWFGYLLTPDTSLQKMLFLVGPKRAGKGTIIRVLKELVGAANVASPTLSSLTQNFGLAPLIGKPVATITDARLSGRQDSAVIVERLLSITGEDPQTIDRKHRDAWHGTLSCRFVLVSNELPRLPDAAGALPSRMICLRLVRSFYGGEDPRLLSRLRPELPGILLWAVEGWRRLRERGRFLQPANALELVTEMEDAASPVGAFVRDRCEVRPDGRVSIRELFTAWTDWCKDRELHPSNQLWFGRNLRAYVPTIKVSQPREDGIQVRYYIGIRIASMHYDSAHAMPF